MKINKLLTFIFVALFLNFQTVSGVVFAYDNPPDKEVILKRKINNDTPPKQTEIIPKQPAATKTTPPPTTKPQKKSLPVDEWNTLITTDVPGIYSQSTDKYGRLIPNRFFFYNQITKRMVEVPNKNSISSTKDLGNLENDYKMYSNKSNTFTHNGKTYKIPESLPILKRILATDSWKHLKTTAIPGIYQMSCFCDKCNMQTEYAFYNTKTKQMVYVKTSKPVSSAKDLGELEDEFIKYGNKFDTVIHNGKTYKIQKGI